MTATGYASEAVVSVTDGTDEASVSIASNNVRIGYTDDPVGPRFELYEAGHATRPGQFVCVFGGEIAAGKVQFIHWGVGENFVAVAELTSTGLAHLGSTLGFYAATPVTKPTVSGSRGGNAALASLLTALATLGLITDGTSA